MLIGSAMNFADDGRDKPTALFDGPRAYILGDNFQDMILLAGCVEKNILDVIVRMIDGVPDHKAKQPLHLFFFPLLLKPFLRFFPLKCNAILVSFLVVILRGIDGIRRKDEAFS